ncbi:hypothetical protein MHB42_03070 [Lysinibacillus sp. FSL K6-0232]|uniref:hypothetical protein n=1 Tax=Lysinibacillus sp. FSL K6-0232 TaxID=2921425 RepID=UPI0030F70DFF
MTKLNTSSTEDEVKIVLANFPAFQSLFDANKTISITTGVYTTSTETVDDIRICSSNFSVSAKTAGTELNGLVVDIITTKKTKKLLQFSILLQVIQHRN